MRIRPGKRTVIGAVRSSAHPKFSVGRYGIGIAPRAAAGSARFNTFLSPPLRQACLCRVLPYGWDNLAEASMSSRPAHPTTL